LRRFADAPVELATLAALLSDAAQRPLLSDAVRVNVVVNRVSDLERGVYRHLPAERSLRLLQAGDFATRAYSAGLDQDVIGEAAVVFVLSVDRAAMLAHDGARGYRHAFLEAGMIGERLLLGAVARGLGACPVGAFYDDEALALLGVDGAREWVVHFAGLGVPAG
jgi:SagB-type dehydrogenase family enzyme